MKTKFFQSPNVLATKIFNHQPYNNWKFSSTNVVTTKNISVTPIYGDQNISITTERGCVICFEKALDKKYDTTPFLGDQKNSITIWQWRFIGWWSIFFCHHSTHLHHRLMTEIFWSPSNGVGVLDGDQKSLVTIWRWTYVRWWLNFSVPKKESMSHVFEKPSMKAFEKDDISQPFVAIKKIWLRWLP